jgi:hypothetical protein
MHSHHTSPLEPHSSPEMAAPHSAATRASRRTCAGCGLAKAPNAFRGRGRGQAAPADLCHRCLHHGVENERARLARRQARSLTAEGQRHCSTCQRLRPLTDFDHDTRCTGGRAYICQPCRAAALELRETQEIISIDNLTDEQIVPGTFAHDLRVSVGLAVAHATCPSGHCRSRAEIAAYAGISAESIRRIEQSALAKIRQGVKALLTEAEISLLEVLW